MSTVAGTIFSIEDAGFRTRTRATAATVPTTASPAAGIKKRRYRAHQVGAGEADATAGAGDAGSTGGGVKSPSSFIALMPHSINSGDQVNLLAARARCRGVAKLQPSQGLHLIGGEPCAPAGLVLALHLAVDGDHPRVVLPHLGGAFEAQGGVDPVRDAGQPGAVVDRDPERPVEDA